MNSNWQPIETAPRDGTWILAICTSGNFVPAVVVYEKGKWYLDEHREGYTLDQWPLTHWMSLPQHPTNSKYPKFLN
jgi:hypothetical protein